MPTLQVGPVALTLEAVNELAHLPAIAELSAENAARSRTASVRYGCAGDVDETPAIAALAPSAVGADIKPAPVIHWHDDGRWCLGRSHRKVRGASRGNQTERDNSS